MRSISLRTVLRHAPGLGLLGLIAVSSLSAPAPARAGMVENMILSKCGEAMLADFKKAGRTPPAGMVDETCQCVLTGWQQKKGLDTSIKSCSTAATNKSGLNSANPTAGTNNNP